MKKNPEKVAAAYKGLLGKYVVSQTKRMTEEDWRRWALNLLKFSAPILAIFFGLLAEGVSVQKALPVALYALYAALSDFFNKWKAETVYVTK